jgi:hypothetical protein
MPLTFPAFGPVILKVAPPAGPISVAPLLPVKFWIFVKVPAHSGRLAGLHIHRGRAGIRRIIETVAARAAIDIAVQRTAGMEGKDIIARPTGQVLEGVKPNNR